MKNELIHHGIKGQKWGVRRFQNSDGSLTPAGKHRYYGEHKQGKLSNGYSTNYNLQYHDSNTDVLKKGSEVRRITNGDEPLDSKRKYVSFTSEDAYHYQDSWEYFWDGYSDMYNKKYTAMSDIKIANGKAVAEHILEKYCNKKLLEYYSENRLGDSARDNQSPHDMSYDSNKHDEVGEKVSATLTKVMRTKMNDVTSYFESQGYDAIADVEDIVGGYAEYPIVLINPQKKWKETHSKKSMDDY